MKIEKVFNVPTNETDVRNRINTYFRQAGYQPVNVESRILTFKRGSKLGSWFPKNPASLLSLAEIEVVPKGKNTDVKAEFDIKTTVRDESHFTDEFWNNEVNEFEIALFKGEYSPLKGKKLTQRMIVANIKSLGPALAYIFIWGALSAVLTLIILKIPGKEKLDPYLVAFGVMVVSAVITLIISRYWRKRHPKNF